MIMAYINYPNPHISIHGNSACSSIQMQGKKGQRIARLDNSTISSQLKRFSAKDYRFGAQAEINDMWLDLNFGDVEFEVAVINYIKRILGGHYRPLASAKVDRHC
jgi:hypothetical protein